MTRGIAAEAPETDVSRFSGSSGLRALIAVADLLGLHLSVASLVRDNHLSDPNLSNAKLLACGASAGLKGRILRLHWDGLAGLQKVLPAIVKLKDGSYMLLTKLDHDRSAQRVHLQDPVTGEDTALILNRHEFEEVWDRDVVLFKRRLSLTDENQPFGYGFIGALIVRERRIARDILVGAVILSFLALAPMLFWRLMSDRVIPFHNMDSFILLCIAMLVLVGAETVLATMRQRLILVLGTRIEIKLATYVFTKVTDLPMDYFERTSAGITLHSMRELDKIKSFVRESLFGTVVDVLVLLIFIPLMYMMAPIPTAFVLAVFCLILIWTFAMLPTHRRYSGARIHAEVMRGVLLGETVQGIRTIKSLSLESKQRQEWDVRTARVARAGYREGTAGNVIQGVVLPLQRLMVSGSLAVGVYLVLSRNDVMFVGALFAFMMLSQRMGQPLMQISDLVQKFDEVRVAVKIVGSLVNQEPEAGRDGRGLRTPLQGHIEFDAVRFQYKGARRPALRDISFDVPTGTTLGVMGRSGSGKTTITRLLQGFHSDYLGSVRVDGVDVRRYDLEHLRSSLGVVLQENFLFSGTIRENIIVAKADATYDELVKAARLSGAEEFIEKLPKGYETYIYEGSPNLSGGQRQRLAIARALINNPRILIFDEATSALDAESEAIVNANIGRISAGRTVVTISHRLASLVKCDAIMVMEGGEINDIGTHEELLARNDIYAGLWFTQNSHSEPTSAPSRPKLAFRGPAGAA